MTVETVLASETLEDFVRNLGFFVQTECLKKDPKGRFSVAPTRFYATPHNSDTLYAISQKVTQYEGFGLFPEPETTTKKAVFYPVFSVTERHLGTEESALDFFKKVAVPKILEKLEVLPSGEDLVTRLMALYRTALTT